MKLSHSDKWKISNKVLCSNFYGYRFDSLKKKKYFYKKSSWKQLHLVDICEHYYETVCLYVLANIYIININLIKQLKNTLTHSISDNSEMEVSFTIPYYV